ncbi:hypothetical protein [Kordia sp.]|uniref:hypothetical protein n=1 Tax=Kordia sp. TaxID=1965332 RepID=UPI0025B9F62D|nr:hypothetical protein [Kordia sp.]MCH2195208.1 hypothetical protein [Kordia sp.]
MYTLAGRELAAPINLSYHAGGHRVNEEASRVGLGWSLSAGGQISRVVKGLPDDYVNGFIHTSTTAADIAAACNGSGGSSGADLCKQIRESSNLYDPQPDDFNYSMLGVSGRFMFNQKRDVNPKGEIVQFPEQNVKIEPIFNNNTIIGWEITDTNGTLYEFSAGNKFIRSQSYQKKDGQFSIPTDGGTSLSYIETWNLTKVTSINGDELSFEYTHELLSNDTATRWEFSHGGQSLILNPLDVWTTNSQGNHQYTIANPYTTESFSTSYRYIEELSKITSSNGYVKFVQAPEQRLDMRSNAKRLQFIEVYNNQDVKLQEIEFFHDYFESTPRAGMLLDHANSAPSNAQSIVTRRLYLDKVQFRGGYNSSVQEDHYEYSFDYNTSQMLPDKQSFAQDHWGYYNGATGNTSLIAIPNGIQISNGANREVNPEYSTACMLEKITYPEGGVTRLFYENNKGDIKTRSLPPYIEKMTTVKALNSHQHTITQNGNATVYRFYSNDFTIASDAKSAPNDANKTQAHYMGASNRCESDNVAAIFDGDDLVCNNMFFKLIKVGSIDPPITGAIWESGYVLLDKGATYKLEIEITSTNNDYSLIDHYSEIELSWFEKNPNTSVQTVDYFGGIRVQAIKTYNASRLASHKSYEYAGGSVVSTPIYLSKDLALHEASGTFSANFYFPTYRITSNSSVPLLTTQSGYVGYTEVTETIHEIAPSNKGMSSNDGDTKSIVRTYSKANDYSNVRLGGVHVYDWKDGNLLTENVQNKQISSTEYQIFETTNDIEGVNLNPPIQSISNATVSRVFGSPIPTFGQLTAAIDRDVLMNELGIDPSTEVNDVNSAYGITLAPMHAYTLFSRKTLPNKNTVITREGDLQLTQITDTYYESVPTHYNPTKTVTTDSKGDMNETIIRYPYEENHTVLLGENRINIPLVTESKEQGITLSTIKSEYGVFEGKNQVARILGAKENTALEERVTYHGYTPYGQPREVSKTGGTSITYLWGYNYNYPVAKIENATYTQVSALVDETTIQNLTGVALENALAPLRANLPNAMVSTYEFEPMVGMIKSSDPRGRQTFYKYDIMGRLEFVLDHDGNVLSQNTYHYKNN